ncbi:MAG: hypothetical protein GY847_09940 [Proteobacteria bacterium]|nr:hypothetical protein [Pseudomonadota bacterium]
MNGVLWIDMAKFRSSSLYEALEILVSNEAIPMLQETAPIDPVKQARELLLAFSGGEQDETDQFLALIKGSFEKEAVLNSFSENEKAVSEEIGGFPAIRTPKFTITVLTDSTLAMGTDLAIKQVTDLAGQKGKSLRNDPDFKDLSLDGSVTARLRYKPGITAPDFTRYGAGASPISMDSIRSVEGSMTLSSGVEIEITATAETQMDAAGISRELENTRRKLGRNMFVVFLGIDWILNRVSISTEQTSVLISAKLDDKDVEEIKRLAARLRKIRELAESDTEGLGETPFHLPYFELPPNPEPKQ